ncbi:MAG: OmpA family protein [Campylobacteraceae bacterium]|jgi:OOP family OmpA-OmpF porin|nr:OmpA family protein [Campylobacteraceae bacterium]
MKKILLLLLANFAFSWGVETEVSVVVGGVHPFDSIKYSVHATYGLRVGINTNNFIIDQFELGYDYSGGVDYYEKRLVGTANPNFIKGSSYIHRIYSNAIKEFEVSKSAKLYALAGIGWESFLQDNDKPLKKYHGKDGTFGQYGAGLKYHLTNDIALKAEVRHGIKLGSPHRDNLYYTLGLSYTFGGDKQTLSQAENNEYSKQTIQEEYLSQKSFNFNSGSAQVSESGKKILKEVADNLKANHDPKIKILLEGHTDSTGSSKYNTKLSQRRADAAKDKLVEYGIGTNEITTKAYGESKPVATNKTKEGRAANRRVEIIFVQ